MATHCLARLTNWEKTGENIGTGKQKASIVRLCKNVCLDGEALCQECSRRPRDGKYQSKMVHGLLTEPIPKNSHIYGSEWYWQKVAKHGESPAAWLQIAMEAQAAGEARAAASGSAWQVQRPGERDMKVLLMAKKEKDSKAATNRLRVAAATAQGVGQTLLKTFAPIKVVYQESAKPIEKVQTDTCKIKRIMLEGEDVWVAENGFVFGVDSTGVADQFLGIYKDGSLVRST